MPGEIINTRLHTQAFYLHFLEITTLNFRSDNDPVDISNTYTTLLLW